MRFKLFVKYVPVLDWNHIWPISNLDRMYTEESLKPPFCQYWANSFETVDLCLKIISVISKCVKITPKNGWNKIGWKFHSQYWFSLFALIQLVISFIQVEKFYVPRCVKILCTHLILTSSAMLLLLNELGVNCDAI